MADYFVRNPLGAAAAWIRPDTSRAFTYSWKNAKFTGYDGVVGLDGELDGGVKFQLRYDWDTNKGFHVNATKGAESRHYVLENQNYNASDPGKEWYIRACNFLNNRRNDDEDEAAQVFLSGRI